MIEGKFAVGIFDSGIGGFSVLNECLKLDSESVYIYFGDNENAPYGSRSEEDIFALACDAMNLLISLHVDVIILACNTVTAVAVEKLRNRYSVPIIGIEPALRLAAKKCRNVLVLGTERTIESARIKKLTRENATCNFILYPCPGLAGEIEQFAPDFSRIRLNEHLPRGVFDGVVLGCTHYSLMRDRIQEYYRVPVYDGNEGVALRLQTMKNEFFRNIQGRMTTFDTKTGMGDHQMQNTNICSRKMPKNTLKIAKNTVIFLKNDKNSNKNRYEQMFLF